MRNSSCDNIRRRIVSNYKDRGPRWCGKIIRVSRIGRKRRVEYWMQSRAKGLWRGKEKRKTCRRPGDWSVAMKEEMRKKLMIGGRGRWGQGMMG